MDDSEAWHLAFVPQFSGILQAGLASTGTTGGKGGGCCWGSCCDLWRGNAVVRLGVLVSGVAERGVSKIGSKLCSEPALMFLVGAVFTGCIDPLCMRWSHPPDTPERGIKHFVWMRQGTLEIYGTKLATRNLLPSAVLPFLFTVYFAIANITRALHFSGMLS